MLSRKHASQAVVRNNFPHRMLQYDSGDFLLFALCFIKIFALHLANSGHHLSLAVTYVCKKTSVNDDGGEGTS